MKKLIVAVFTCVMIFSVSSSVWAANKKKDIPPWMEDVTSNKRNVYLIPKGAKKEIIGSQVVVESSDEYVARRLYEIEKYLEKRFAEMNQNQINLRSDVDDLKGTVEYLEQEFSKEIEKGIEKKKDASPKEDSSEGADAE